jgi:hypothetical protein
VGCGILDEIGPEEGGHSGLVAKALDEDPEPADQNAEFVIGCRDDAGAIVSALDPLHRSRQGCQRLDEQAAQPLRRSMGDEGSSAREQNEKQRCCRPGWIARVGPDEGDSGGVDSLEGAGAHQPLMAVDRQDGLDVLPREPDQLEQFADFSI